MNRPTIPPKFINIPAGIAYRRDLPASVILTYIQLRGLAWDSKGALKVDWNDLFYILGKPRTTIYRHLAKLASSNWLRFNSTHRRLLVVYFSGPGEFPESSHFATALNEDDNQTDSINLENHHTSIDKPKVHAQKIPQMGQSCQKWDNDNGWHPIIDDELAELLDRVGVYRDKFADVAAAGWTMDQIRTLSLSVLTELGPGKGGGVLLYRLKNTPPPQTEAEQRAGYAESLRKYGA